MTAKKKPALSRAHRKHQNPEIQRAEAVDPKVRFSEEPASEFPGVVYVTSGVPAMTVRVLAGQHVKDPDDEHGPGGDRHEGDEFKTDGPTAHMLEARGYVEIIEEHA